MKKENLFVIVSLLAGGVAGFIIGRYKYNAQKTSAITGIASPKAAKGNKVGMTPEQICSDNCYASSPDATRGDCDDLCGNTPQTK